MHKEGAKIIGVIEKDVGLFNSQGMNPDQLALTMQLEKSLKNFSEAEEVEITDPTVLMRKKCHIMALCSTYGTLNKQNAELLKAKVVIEVANGPTTFAADEILLSKGIHIVPDILANIGGCVVDYLEWLKNLDHVSPGRMTKKFQE